MEIGYFQSYLHKMGYWPGWGIDAYETNKQQYESYSNDRNYCGPKTIAAVKKLKAEFNLKDNTNNMTDEFRAKLREQSCGKNGISRGPLAP